ncbi:MAG: hypothetical protein J6A54_00025 [Clostridia bacterium]|nr:hypothetical protein [Clostridia bacterium]
MDRKLLDEFKVLKPNRRIIYLNDKNNRYDIEYARFNLDILKTELEKTTLEYELLDGEIILSGGIELFKELLFDCAIYGAFDEKRGTITLKLYTTATDIMSVACRLLEKFEKLLDQE